MVNETVSPKRNKNKHEEREKKRVNTTWSIKMNNCTTTLKNDISKRVLRTRFCVCVFAAAGFKREWNLWGQLKDNQTLVHDDINRQDSEKIQCIKER